MAEIMPFRGLLYSAEKSGDLNKVMAPPYDVISPRKQDEFYERHPQNIIRLILSKIYSTDVEGRNDRYTRAASDLKKWVEEGVLAKDSKPAIYYYTQTYALKSGRKQTRKGFIALAKLMDYGKGLHPHEKTLSGPKADRLKLMQACDVNLSCIFSLYSDPLLKTNRVLDSAVAGKPPVIDVADDDGIVNRVWRIDDAEVIKTVSEGMKEKPLFIADGHHRYETALNYRNIMREKNKSHTGLEPYNYVMMYFSNMDDEGMTIWPTHRIVHSLKDFRGDKLLAECKKYFDVEEFSFNGTSEANVRKSFLEKLESTVKDRISIGLQIRGRDTYHVLTLKSKDVMDKVFGDKIPDVFKNLDVTVLHSLILNNILGITQEAQEKQTNINYVKSYDEAFASMKKEENQAVFLLNATKIEQVKAVAEAGFVMPQKSTYFYPKLLSGLVINQLGSKSGEAAPV